MKQELSWKVKVFDTNSQSIKDYNILKNREDFIKKQKKKCATKEEFAEELRHEFLWMYWSRCEWELIIKLTDDGRVILSPWVGCSNPEDVAIDVTDDTTFDWTNFAEYHIDEQIYIYRNKAKIDVYDQIMWTWPQVAEYCWHTRLKYERDHPKFHE